MVQFELRNINYTFHMINSICIYNAADANTYEADTKCECNFTNVVKIREKIINQEKPTDFHFYGFTVHISRFLLSVYG